MRARASLAGLAIGAVCASGAVCAADYQSVDPNWMPSRLYFAGGSLRPRVMDLVADPDAPTGQAGYARAGVKESGWLADSYTYENIPGRYRSTFFFKVADNTSNTVVCEYSVRGAVHDDPRGASITLKASDFKQPNVYQSFTYDWEYYEIGFMVAAGAWYGKADLWWGGVETRLIEAFDDDALLAKWEHPPPQKFEQPFPPKGMEVPPVIPPEVVPPKGIPRVQMIEGMYFDFFGVGEAIGTMPGAMLAESETRSGSQTADICTNFPAARDLVGQYNVLVLANVDIRRLGILRRYAIREFVARGGGVLVLGGPWTYGRCAMRGTWTEQALPVRTKGISDWIELPAGSALQWTAAASTVFAPPPLSDRPCVRYVHDADLREGARVVLEAGGKPVLAVWQCGKGRVAAFLGTPMGEPGEGRIGFWESASWRAAMAEILKWLAGA